MFLAHTEILVTTAKLNFSKAKFGKLRNVACKPDYGICFFKNVVKVKARSRNILLKNIKSDFR